VGAQELETTGSAEELQARDQRIKEAGLEEAAHAIEEAKHVVMGFRNKVCMCMCMHVCMYVCIRVCMCVRVYLCVESMCVQPCMHACIRLWQ